jgi:hypothetical protein
MIIDIDEIIIMRELVYENKAFCHQAEIVHQHVIDIMDCLDFKRKKSIKCNFLFHAKYQDTCKNRYVKCFYILAEFFFYSQ